MWRYGAVHDFSPAYLPAPTHTSTHTHGHTHTQTPHTLTHRIAKLTFTKSDFRTLEPISMFLIPRTALKRDSYSGEEMFVQCVSSSLKDALLFLDSIYSLEKFKELGFATTCCTYPRVERGTASV
jgi:hypothetical protein